MNHLPPRNSVTRRLASFAQRFKPGNGDTHKVAKRSRALHLPFEPLDAPISGIGWQSGPPLHRLIDLPRDALSGPVQDDKARMHGVLKRLVTCHCEEHPGIDLRALNGLCSRQLQNSALPSFEELTQSDCQRKVRIISFSDFTKTLSKALPGFEYKTTLQLQRASWHGERLFWSEDNYSYEMANAVVYARRRGLAITQPAVTQSFKLDTAALNELDRNFHMLSMPAQAWSDPVFMGLLLDTGLPYARFGLFNTETPESLLLPRNQAQANVIGETLRAIGAADVVDYLRRFGNPS